nr:MFS transporter [Candidatus Njordarchaeum guaymaensis]
MRIAEGWRAVCGSLVVLLVGAGVGFYSFGVFLVALTDHFGWSRGEVSQAFTISSLIVALLGPLAGRMIEKHDPRRIMMPGALLLGMSFLFLSTTSGILEFYMLNILYGVGMAYVGLVANNTVISAWFQGKSRRGIATGIGMSGIGLGGLLIAPLSQSLISEYGWRETYLIYGLAIWVVMVPAILVTMRRIERIDKSIVNPKARAGVVGRNSLGEPLSHPEPVDPSQSTLSTSISRGKSVSKTLAFWLLATAFFLVALAQVGVLIHQFAFVSDKGISAQEAASVLGLTAGLGVVGKLVFGAIIDRAGSKFTAMVCFATQSLGLLIFVYAREMLAIWLFAFVFGISMGGVISVEPVLVADVFRDASFGATFGFLQMAASFGSALGPLLAGVMHDIAGSYDLIFLYFAALYLLATVLTCLVRRRD